MIRLGGPYWRVWTAAVVSTLGDGLRVPALALLTASLTRSPAAVAAVTVAGQLPWLLFGVLGGALADRWDRRRAMATADGLRAALVLGFAVVVGTGHASVSVLAVFAFALTSLGTLFDASAVAVLPALVPAGRLAAANGRLQAGMTTVRGYVGAPLGAVLFAAAAAVPFMIDSLSFVVAALLALSLPTAAGRTADQAAPRRAVFASAGDGLRWLFRERVVRSLTLLSAACNLVIGGLLAVVVLVLLDHLHVPERGYGLASTAMATGAVIAGLFAGPLGARLGELRALAAILTVQTGALLLLGLADSAVPGIAALAVFSAGTAVWNVLSLSYTQEVTPGHVLGRVGNAQRVVGVVTAPVGAALAGILASAAGIGALLLTCAGVFALVATAGWWVALRGRPAADAGRDDDRDATTVPVAAGITPPTAPAGSTE